MSTIPNIYTPHCAMCRAGFGRPLVGVDPEALCVFHLRASLAATRVKLKNLTEAAHGVVDERDPATLRGMVTVLKTVGREAEANLCAVLAEIASEEKQ